MLKNCVLFVRALSVMLALTLAACGGGGGGGNGGGGAGGGGGGTGFSVQVDHTTIAFNYIQGDTPSATVLNVTGSGTPPTSFTVVFRDEGNYLDTANPVYTGSTSAAISVQPRAGLSAGTYTGTLTLNACADGQQCLQPWPGSPMNVTYTITVTAPVFTGPPQFGFQATFGQSTPISPFVQLTLASTSGNWTAKATAPWLTLSATSGTDAAVISVVADGQGMAVGTYTASVTVTSANGSQTSTFTLQIGPAGISPTPLAANFSGINGNSFTPVSVSVAVSQGITAMTATADEPWIVVSQVTAPNAPTPGSFTVTVNPAVGPLPLASGSYSGNVQVTVGSGSTTTSVQFPVNLTLTAPTLTVSPQKVVFGGSAGRTFSPATLSVSLNTGSGQYPWSIQGPPAWLNLSSTGGAPPAQVVVTPVPANASPGTMTVPLTFMATVNGDFLGASVLATLNLDSHLLLASQAGVAFVSTPTANWSRLTQAVKVSDNYGLATPWTAQSDQSWLQVTSSGTAGGTLTLTANPTGLAADQLYIANVTIKSSDVTIVNPEHIRVGLWVASATPAVLPAGTTSFAGAAQINAMVADPIRPYVYAHESNSTSVRVFNLYTETELAPITGLPAATVSLTVGNDGNTLFALGSTGPVIATANLNTGVAATVLSIPASPDASQPLDFIRYVRTNGREFIMDGVGRTFRVTDGSQAGNGNVDYFAVTTDGSKLFNESSSFTLDYTDAGGGVFSIAANPGNSGIAAQPARVGDVTNVDGSSFCVPALNGASCVIGGNPVALSTNQAMSTNNLAMGADGRLYVGVIPGLPFENDLYLYSATGTTAPTVLKSNQYNLGDRTMVISSDGFVLAGATPNGQPPSVLIMPIGP